jgi:subtilisin family serine protease
MFSLPRFSRATLAACGLLLAPMLPSAGAAPQWQPQEPDRRYLVELVADPLATYDGHLPGLNATDPNTVARQALRRELAAARGVSPAAVAERDLPQVVGAARLEVGSPAARAYAGYLRDQQDAMMGRIQRLAPGARALMHYAVVFNGMTVRMTPYQASLARRLPGVRQVTEEEPVELFMDTAAERMELPGAWSDPRVGGRADAGKGIRVGIIDAGVAGDHPMFDDTGFQAPPGFPKATRRVGDQVDDLSAGAETMVNNKVIVSRVYVNPEIARQPGGDQITPYPGNTHGTHVAGIAAGNVVQGGPNEMGWGELSFSGVAPGAYIMAYRFDYSYTPEILQAIEDAVADKADVINNSWGTALMHTLQPDQHPIARGFKAAVAANVVVVAAGGNAGAVGEASLGGPHQMIPEVITVSNSEHGRRFAYNLEASGPSLDEGLEFIDGGQLFATGDSPWSRITGAAYAKEICGDTANTGARDKVAYLDYTVTCTKPVVNVPANLAQYIPAFVQQLVGARQAGAKAAVVYVKDPGKYDANQVALFNLVKQIFRAQLPDQLYNLPPTLVVLNKETGDLATWLDARNQVDLTVSITPQRAIDQRRANLGADSTAQGPAPQGSAMKPDISAPGTDILSAIIGGGYAELTGTSMASPAIAGCVAVLRQAFPNMSPADVKAALMNTSDPVVANPANPSSPAPATMQGAGRVNLARAMDPGLLVTPPGLELGMGYGRVVTYTLRLRDARRQPDGPVTYQLLHQPHPRNVDLTPQMPTEVTVPAGGEAKVTVRFDFNALPFDAPDYYDGRILFQGPRHAVRVTYSGRLLEEAKDVLVINARRGFTTNGNQVVFTETTDYRQHWEKALQQAELTYDVWDIGEGGRTRMPTLSTLQRYRMVILAGGDSNVPLEVYDNGRSAMSGLANYLQGGGAMLASGAYFPDSIRFNNNQNSGSTHMLKRYFGGFELTEDDVELPGGFKSVAVFSKPVQLNTGSDPDAAANAYAIDLGEPLDTVDSAPRAQGQPPAPDYSWSHLAVQQLFPYIHTVMETEDGAAVMTGVSGDPSLEKPVHGRDQGVTWRALFAGFPVEAVSGDRTHLTRVELLTEAFEWLTEPEPRAIRIAAPDGQAPAREIRLQAQADLPIGHSGVAGWRWDAGDGKGIQSTTRPELRVTYPRAGKVTIRVELTSKIGHRYVETVDLDVGGGGITPRRSPTPGGAPATATPKPSGHDEGRVYLPLTSMNDTIR